jgi:hypothetical protein
MMLEIVGKPDELHALVRGWDGNKNRLVKAAPHHLHLAIFHKSSQALEIGGAVLFNPGQQRPGVMEAHVNGRVLLKRLDKRQVAALERLLKNMAEVAARLMGVNEKDQMELWRHGNGAISRETE